MQLPEDGSLGPLVSSISDFSLRFEEVVLRLLPSGSFLFFVSATVLYYRQRPARIRYSRLLWIKLIVAVMLMLLELSSLVLRCVSPERTSTTYGAAAIDFAAALGIGAVVYVEHRHAIRTSTLLGLYLVFGVLIDIAKSRSYLKRDLTASGCVAVATATVRLVLVGLEEVPKKHLLIDPNIRSISDGEVTSGFFTRILFLFLRPMLRTGFHSVLTVEGLGGLGIEFASKSLFSSLLDNWQSVEKTKRRSLFLACCKTWKVPILAILVPRVCVTGLKFAQPFLMQAIIDSIGSQSNTSTQKKIGLIGATGFTFVGAAICRTTTTHLKNRLVARLRGGLFSHLLYKSYRLEVQEGRKKAAITLMSADFDGIASSFPAFIEMPFTVLDCGVGMFFLSRFTGLSCLAIFVPLIASTVLGLLFGRPSTSALKLWNENIQARVAKTSRMLSQLPAIKALGLGPKTAEFIQSLRVTEIASSKKYRVIQAISTALAVVVDLVTPVVVVAVALFTSALGHRISAQVLYPTLGIVSLVQGPLAELLKGYPTSMAMMGCFERIEAFLCLEDHKDPRVVVCSDPPQASGEGQILEKLPATAFQIPQQASTHIIRFDKATIAPRGSDTPVLNFIDLEIISGSINGVYGHTSSGKSTFLESILGEAEILDGTLYVDNITITVCAQRIWLPNTSFRECIIGDCEYDRVWFNIVVTRCGLQQDLAALPNGEDYVIGSDGVALSGGQCQRIGIARAVYPRPRAIILDDVFSSIDRRTALDILTGLCGENGLLRNSGCTVIMATYLPESLDVVQNLILLDDDGAATCEPRWKPNGKPSETAVFLQRCMLPQQDVAARQELPYERPRATAMSSRASAPPRDSTQGDVGKGRGKGDFTLYLLWFNAIGSLVSTFWALLVLLMGTTEVFTSIYVRIWIAVAPSDRLFIIGYAIIALSSGLLCGLCIFLNHVHLSPRASLALHDTLTTTVAQSTLGFLSTTDSGSILNRYSQDMDLLAKHIPQAIYATLYCGATSTVQIGVILSSATYMTAVLPFIFISVFFIQRYYLRSSRQLRLLEIEAQAPLVTELRETATGLIYIRAFRCQEHSFNRGLRLLDLSQKPFYFLLCSQAFLALTLDLLASAVALILAIVTLFARNPSQNATGLAFLLLINIGTSFNRFVTYWAVSETSVGSLSRLRDFFDHTPKEPSNRATVDLPPDWPSNGVIQINNVSARYRVKKEEPDDSVLHDLSLAIEPGKKIGIMGRTGSGKSSLLSTLLGFLEYDGSIYIDGVDIKKADPNQLRSRIITISQDIVELEGTIRDNLLPFDKLWSAPSGTIDEKAKEKAERRDAVVRETLVRLRIWDRLVKYGGLDANLDAVGYSRGEKQLMCIARAVVRRRLTGSRLLLVDEATANVDPWRDQIVREMMKEYFRGCTIIVVAHRTETIADSNRTVHMAGGYIEKVENHW